VHRGEKQNFKSFKYILSYIDKIKYRNIIHNGLLDLENYMTDDINKKITRIEYLKKVRFKFTNQLFSIVFIIFYYLYLKRSQVDFQINDLKL
jgi:hypothetical protein